MGYVLIFNSETFKNEDLNRNGSIEDLKVLAKVFHRFNFRVKIKRNPTLSVIRNSMQLLLREPLHTALCLVVIIMTHGEQSNVALAQDRTYSVEEEIINSEVFRTFEKLPKIVVTQACYIGQVTDANLQASNILRLDSTFKGCVSTRYRNGSPFIQLFCKHLLKSGLELDIETIADQVLIDFSREHKDLLRNQSPTVTTHEFRQKVCFGERVPRILHSNTEGQREFV